MSKVSDEELDKQVVALGKQNQDKQVQLLTQEGLHSRERQPSLQDGMDRPKSELAYRVPSTKFTRKKIQSNEKLEELAGLDTTIDWKNTGDNSYDGEKLNLLVHDESGKWERPDNILNNWRVTKTCLRLGSRIVGKCLMGSTSNALDKGGSNFKKLYNDSDVSKRNRNGQTKSGLYSLFIPVSYTHLTLPTKA